MQARGTTRQGILRRVPVGHQAVPVPQARSGVQMRAQTAVAHDQQCRCSQSQRREHLSWCGAWAFRCLTLELSGGRRQAKAAGGRPLERLVRPRRRRGRGSAHAEHCSERLAEGKGGNWGCRRRADRRLTPASQRYEQTWRCKCSAPACSSARRVLPLDGRVRPHRHTLLWPRTGKDNVGQAARRHVVCPAGMCVPKGADHWGLDTA